MMNYALAILAVSVSAVKLTQEYESDSNGMTYEEAHDESMWYDQVVDQYADQIENAKTNVAAIVDFKDEYLPTVDVTLPTIDYDMEGDEGLNVEGPTVDITLPEWMMFEDTEGSNSEDGEVNSEGEDSEGEDAEDSEDVDSE